MQPDERGDDQSQQYRFGRRVERGAVKDTGEVARPQDSDDGDKAPHRAPEYMTRLRLRDPLGSRPAPCQDAPP